MTDTEYLQWIANHLFKLEVGTSTDRVKISWFDGEGFDQTTMGEPCADWLDGLRSAIDKAME